MAPSTEPTSPSYSESSKQFKPNPHPYAIKTTSTGILTRSNSTTSQNTSKHFYVPQSPSRSNSSQEKSKSRRLSKSFSTDPLPNPNPRPLPTPPTDVDDWTSHKWNKRADISSGSHGNSNPVKLEDLPSNPKIWTPSQLSSYLTTSLRVRSGETLLLPIPVIRDITAFVKETKINGRLFLRLSEQDLEGMGINELWRSALLSASRTLRQNVLKGRIWGESDSVPFSSKLYNSASSSSSVDLPVTDTELNSLSIRKLRRYRSGRVRGMVESFERSGSFSSDSGFNSDIDFGAANQHVDEEAVSPSPIASVNSSPVRRPLPDPPLHPSLRDFPLGDSEEPSIEELLEEERGIVRGARAWEEIDRNPGVTVKKLLIEHGSIDGLSTVVSSKYGGSGGSTKSRDERRIVTSIFSPFKAKSEEAEELMKHKEEEMNALLKSSNELLETFKMRLEQVEQRVGEMEDSERALQLELSRRDVENDELKKKLETANTDKDITERLDPQTMSALSQYVLLAGIGVFSVVLRTVLRRIVGQRSDP